MCSVNDPDFELPETISEPVSLSNVCKKCKDNQSVVTLRVKDQYCKDCFISGSIHKFRSSLGKNKVLRPNDKVLVAFKGQSGLAMLHLIQSGADQMSHKRMVYHTSVLIVDDGTVFHDSREERQNDIRAILETVGTFNLPVYVVSLESALLLDSDADTSLDIRLSSDYEVSGNDETNSNRLKQMFAGCKGGTEKEYLIKHLKNILIKRAAKQLEIEKVFTGESSTSLAVDLISGMACGRGAQVNLDTSFEDKRFHEVRIIRPMREFDNKEIAFYTSLNELPSLPPSKSFSTAKDNFFSIQKLTESFILNLQSGYPATVPTIFRTGDKLFTSREQIDELKDNHCLLCHGILDASSKASSLTLEATKFSQLISRRGKLSDCDSQMDILAQLRLDESSTMTRDSSSCNGDGLCSEGGGGCSKSSGNPSDDPVNSYLCYACKLVIGQMEAPPQFLLQEARKLNNRSTMRSQISEFLLE